MKTLRDRHTYAATLFLALGVVTWGDGLAAQETGKPGTMQVALSSPQPDYGTAAESSVFLPGSAFSGALPGITVGDDCCLSAIFGGTNPVVEAWAPVYFPQGALITGIDLYYYDTNVTQTLDCNLFEVPGSGSIAGNIAHVQSVGSAGWGVATQNLVSPWQVNNASNGYLIFMTTDGSGPVTDQSIRWRGVKVRYKLQVSPAPSVATFSDVPTSHPYFKFVEALAAAGITGGCGGGKFCPDTPLTRGQMAVFLSVALGLYWPN